MLLGSWRMWHVASSVFSGSPWIWQAAMASSLRRLCCIWVLQLRSSSGHQWVPAVGACGPLCHVRRREASISSSAAHAAHARIPWLRPRRGISRRARAPACQPHRAWLAPVCPAFPGARGAPRPPARRSPAPSAIA
eukprot:358937-Chlamydomonas_euryale.AAC.9